MKDSQPHGRAVGGHAKYIKESNERFSTIFSNPVYRA